LSRNRARQVECCLYGIMGFRLDELRFHVPKASGSRIGTLFWGKWYGFMHGLIGGLAMAIGYLLGLILLQVWALHLSPKSSWKLWEAVVLSIGLTFLAGWMVLRASVRTKLECKPCCPSRRDFAGGPKPTCESGRGICQLPASAVATDP